VPQVPPISLKMLDADGASIFQGKVDFTPGMTARDALEQAFIENQSSESADPFAVSFAFFGYSYAAQYPGYLGYEVEGFGVDMKHLLVNNDGFYWELYIDDQVAQVGADLTLPQPGGSLTWRYTPVAAALPTSLRAVIHARRSGG